MKYKETVGQIVALQWGRLQTEDLKVLMVLSAVAATEFARSLRLALRVFPSYKGLEEMSRGELLTGNLTFEEYDKVGDHSDFLWYFITKHQLTTFLPRARPGLDFTTIANSYYAEVGALAPMVQAMSVVSREQELPEIFKQILLAEGWSDHQALRAFRYYLEAHIRLDSEEDGHADLTADIEVDDSVEIFYQIRLNLYRRGLPRLFQ